MKGSNAESGFFDTQQPQTSEPARKLLAAGALVAIQTHFSHSSWHPTAYGWQTIHDRDNPAIKFDNVADVIGRAFMPRDFNLTPTHMGSPWTNEYNFNRLEEYYTKRGIHEGVAIQALARRNRQPIPFSSISGDPTDANSQTGRILFTTFVNNRKASNYPTPDGRPGNRVSLSVITPLQAATEFWHQTDHGPNPATVRQLVEQAREKLAIPDEVWHGRGEDRPTRPPFEEYASGNQDGHARMVLKGKDLIGVRFR